jgi:hypothetical protein
MILKELEGLHWARACGPGAKDQCRSNKAIIAGPYLLSSDNYKWFVCKWMRGWDRSASLEVEEKSKAPPSKTEDGAPEFASGFTSAPLVPRKRYSELGHGRSLFSKLYVNACLDVFLDQNGSGIRFVAGQS